MPKSDMRISPKDPRELVLPPNRAHEMINGFSPVPLQKIDLRTAKGCVSQAGPITTNCPQLTWDSSENLVVVCVDCIHLPTGIAESSSHGPSAWVSSP